jgi:long-chain acyl-CoA synthetase
MDPQGTDYIHPDTAVSLYGLFRERLRRSPDSEAYRYYDVPDRAWKGTSWRDTAEAVARWQAALAAEGLAPGDRVALMLRNSREWAIFDQAALGLGLVTVPMYNEDRGDSVAYLLGDSGARLLLIEGHDQWDKLAPVADRLTGVERIVALDDIAEVVSEPRLRWAATWLPGPGERCELAPGPEDPDALATIVYTSGTTGRPKGVMLSHRNILANAHNGLRTAAVYPSDLFLSFLPLSHTLERTVGYYLPMMAGATVAHSRSINHLAEDLTAVRPTLLVSVPRVFERVYNRLRDKLAHKPLSRGLFQAAVAAGWHRFEHGQGRAPWHPLLLAEPLLHLLVGRKVLARLGGRLRFAISGGAALPEPVAHTFIGLGLTLLQGYGLTEYSPVISVNRMERNDPTTVGPPLPDTEVAIGAEDELLVRGPSVMLGYWNLPEATAERIDPDGWLHTGDRARLDNGYLRITGRLKEIIVLSNGEKVPPEDLESAISMDPVFEQAVVMGESRPYLAALVVVDPEHWREVAGERCANPAEDIPADDYCQRLALERIGQDLREFPGYARVRRVAVSDEPWTVDNGLMTPSLKPKRQRILDHFGDKVAAVYAGHHSPADNQERRPAGGDRA